MEMAGVGTGQICYVDTRAALGHMLELYPESPELRSVYAGVRHQSERWDGSELIRPLNLASISA